jgi:hypothetical protein
LQGSHWRLAGLGDGFQTDAIAVEKIGIDGNTDCGTRTAPTENLADTFDLGKFLGEDRVSGVINLRRRNVGGCQRQQDDRSVRRIDFAVAGLTGKISGKLRASGVDSSLNVTGGGIDISIQVELKDDVGVPETAR